MWVYLDGEITFEEKKVTFITDYILNSIANADKKLLEYLIHMVRK